MNYKFSEYNYFYKQDEDTYTCVNLINKTIFGLNNEKYNLIEQNKTAPTEIRKLNPNLFSALIKLGVIIDESFDEISFLKTEHRKIIYSPENFRLTVLPTLECNFKCWYCYEENVTGQMTDKTMQSLLKYLKYNVFNTAIKKFQLDWFGGEPLLYFDDVVYPLSKQIKSLCEENHIEFNNMITTNGFLINKEMIGKFKLINLSGFQITLDGNEKHHNKVKKGKNVYKRTIENIIAVLENIENINFLLRINYTEKNIKGITEIIKDIPNQYRNKIEIGLQQVWQTEEVNKNIDVSSINLEFENSGFIAPLYKLEERFYRCYADLLSQLVVNYNGYIYKCTARDYANQEPDGIINNDGQINWNSPYYKRMAKTTIESDKCLKCNFLPVCWGPCSQKLLEYKENEFEKICNIAGIESTVKYFLNNFYNNNILKNKA